MYVILLCMSVMVGMYACYVRMSVTYVMDKVHVCMLRMSVCGVFGVCVYVPDVCALCMYDLYMYVCFLCKYVCTYAYNSCMLSMYAMYVSYAMSVCNVCMCV